MVPRLVKHPRTCRGVHTLGSTVVLHEPCTLAGTLLWLAFISRVPRWRSRPVSHVPGYVRGIWFYRPRAFAYGAGVPTLVHMCRLRDAAFSYSVARTRRRR